MTAQETMFHKNGNSQNEGEEEEEMSGTQRETTRPRQ